MSGLDKSLQTVHKNLGVLCVLNYLLSTNLLKVLRSGWVALTSTADNWRTTGLWSGLETQFLTTGVQTMHDRLTVARACSQCSMHNGLATKVHSASLLRIMLLNIAIHIGREFTTER